MEFKQLRYFKRVADTGSVSRAAAALSVAQPAVSRQIANLEESLGTPLFFRNGRGVTLTEAGEHLYASADAILESVRQAEQGVRDSAGVARGTVLIGSMPSVVRIVAPPLVRFVRKNHPELDLEFTAGLSGYVNEWLSNGLLDVAIIHDATRTQHFLTEPLVSEELVLVGIDGDKRPVTFQAMSAMPLIVPRRAHGLRLQLERVASQMRTSLNIRYEIDSIDAIKALVREGQGIAVMPRAAVSAKEGFSLQPVTEPAIYRQLLLATSSQRPVSQTTRVVIHELKRQIKAMLGTPDWPGAMRAGERLGGKPDPSPVVTIDQAA